MNSPNQLPDSGDSSPKRSWLPRLSPGAYRGPVSGFWTSVVNLRSQGWLCDSWHAAFREVMIHTCHRFSLCCPVYTLMPDHIHFLWTGLSPESDQTKASVFLRTHLKPAPADWQNQPYDHLLREQETERNAFQKTAEYILQNPVRKGLASVPDEWRWSGSVFPGYPRLCVFQAGYWELFWKLRGQALERNRLRQDGEPPA